MRSLLPGSWLFREGNVGWQWEVIILDGVGQGSPRREGDIIFELR